MVKKVLPLLATISAISFCGIYFQDSGSQTLTSIFHHQRLKGPLSGEDPWVVDVVRTSYISPPSKLPYNLSTVASSLSPPSTFIYNPSAKPKYKDETRSGSWHYIHHYTQQLFSGEGGGFFVEAGALDGQHLSNTLWLEQHLNWTGLLIEPNKDSYRHLLSKHRRSWTSNTCLSTENYPKETIMVNLKLQKQLQGIEWHFRGSSHELGHNIPQNESLFFKQTDKSYSSVQCFPLFTYVLAMNVSVVDFLSLDMQGGEKQVLRHFPFNKIKVRVIVVEITDTTPDYDFIKYMESKGYTLISRNGVNLMEDQIYVRNGEPSLRNFIVSGS